LCNVRLGKKSGIFLKKSLKFEREKWVKE